MEFLYPQVLYALFAVAIPIAIHLFNFRRYQKVWFSNVALLKSIQKKTKRQSQLRQLLVLLMRILSIIALVLAFASPYIPNDKVNTHPEKRSFVSIYLDNSFSMTHLGENGSLLNEAQNMALGVLNSYKNTDRFQLITNDMQSRHFRWFNKMEMTKNIMEVEAVHMQQNLSKVFQREQMLRNQESKPITQASLYLLSDFQKNSSFRSSVEVDSVLKVRLIPLQNNPVNNLSIDSLWFSHPVQLPLRESILNVRLSNHGTEAQNSIPLKLFIEEEQKAVLSVDLKAGEKHDFQMSFINQSEGKKLARIEIEDYPIVYDDRMYFVFEVRDVFNVAMINQDQSNAYLQKLYEEDSLVYLSNYSVSAVDYTGLKQMDLVVLNELTTWSSGLRNQLSDYVKNGGLLLQLPSEIENSNNGLGLDNTPVYQQLKNTQTYLLEIEKDLAFFNQVFDQTLKKEHQNQKIDLPQISEFYSFEKSSSKNSIALLKARTQEPILWQTKIGKGVFYQMAMPLRMRFSQLPQHALFVAVFNQMLLQSDIHQRYYEILGSGESILLSPQLSGLQFSGDQAVVLQMGEEQWIPQMHNSGANNIVLSQLEWPSDGFAQASMGTQSVDQIAVNYNRNESDFKVYSKKELSDIISENKWPNFQIIESTPNKISAQLAEMDQMNALWRVFLFLAFFFIFVETLILRLWK